MLRSARRSNPGVPWGLVWLALGLIAFTVLVALAAAALAAPGSPGVVRGSADPSVRASADPSVRASADPSVRASADPSVRASADPSVRASVDPSACPGSDRTQAVSSRPGAGSALVPPGARQLLICRYSGLQSHLPKPYTLIAARLVRNPTEAQRVGRELNALPPPPPYLFCPANFGDVVVVRVLYASGAQDPVTIDQSGCQTVGNGRRTARSGAVAIRLAALAPVPRQARIGGRVQVCGGPAPGACHVESPTWCESTPASCLKADRIAIVGADSAREVVGIARGRFGPIGVPPGRYTVQLLGDNSRIRGHVLLTQHITLGSGESGTVVFGFDVP